MSLADLPRAGGRSLRFHELLQERAPAYLERWGAALPVRQRQVLAKILACRTPALGGELYACPQCGTTHYVYHSCNDRHCPRCGQPDTEEWLARHQSLLLPVPYFLVTFTVPEALRAWLRAHPQVGLNLLFRTSAEALQDLARQPRRLGASLGMLGVLHTWSRTLGYHPHVHYLVPGGGLSRDERQWVASRPDFLLPVHPLADHFRTLVRRALEAEAPEALATMPARVWQTRWVVHCQPAGSGQQALAYLSRYVFKTATGDRRLTLLPDGRVLWPYRDSATGRPAQIVLEPDELIRRFLQHVLPAGFHRVRCFGWLHPGGRRKLNRVRALLRQSPILTAAEQAAWQPPTAAGAAPALVAPPESSTPDVSNAPTCPRCQQPMRHVGSWRPGQPRLPPPERVPP